MQKPLPVHLITGLLGSGKTTCLKQLIKQKPSTENWLILINEFGEVDIDASQLSSLLVGPPSKLQSINIQAVSGGCICCTAQLGLVNTLNQVLSQDSLAISRIWIEPTGLGHPAKIIDALQNSAFAHPLDLQKISCVITPQQLTPQRWQKSTVMRDLVHLADCIILNKTDLSDDNDEAQALKILAQCYPPKTEVIKTQHSLVKLDCLMQSRKQKGLTLLSQTSSTPLNLGDKEVSEHEIQTTNTQQIYPSIIPNTLQCFLSTNNTGNPLNMGWIWSPTVQFKRTEIKTFFETIGPKLIRAKGILKTGNEWQLINWSDGQISFEDIAWREDSRIECLFDEQDWEVSFTADQLEKQLIKTIHSY